eukprot:14227079-Alexandrium_andersonii.AAC.1
MTSAISEHKDMLLLHEHAPRGPDSHLSWAGRRTPQAHKRYPVAQRSQTAGLSSATVSSNPTTRFFVG